PKLWTVMTWVPGLPLDRGTITRPEHAADTLAAFLRALHVSAPADAPSDTMGIGAHPRDSSGGIDHFLHSIDTTTLAADAAQARAVWEDAAAAPAWDGPRVWVHGDLHPANVVVADGTLTGVVDFGALFAGDPQWILRPPGCYCRQMGPSGSSRPTARSTRRRCVALVGWLC
ncbi:phosphotransferase, partial [Pseudonocardia sp. KRD291]|uniref:phosphotransferase n=1 Tax=Pseudonocardia sp. KRD291 TaxID=2792007 RepID=UPI001CF79A5D